MVGVIAPVGDEAMRWSGGLHQSPREGDVIGIARGKQQNPWPAESIGQPVQLAGPAAPRAAYGLREGPPFPPAAERCAFTWVASIETMPCGPQTPECPVSASNIPCQMPCLDQRLKRL